MPVPDALRGSVLKRLQSLDHHARAVLMRAAVVGRNFDLDVVVATATRREADVRRALERACRLQLVVEIGADRFSFRHALTQKIIYAELLDARVRPLHRRIARALERALPFKEVPLEKLAYHSWAAGDVRRALRYNELAGDRAAAVHADEDARRYYARARSLTQIDSGAYRRVTQKLRAVRL
jgi:predicted ATPase